MARKLSSATRERMEDMLVRPERETVGGPGTDQAQIGLTEESEGPDCSGPGKPAGEMGEQS